MADTTQKTSAVASIPAAALNAITDPNVRTVLQTLVDGWNVRNGNTGTGDNQFVTRADLGMAGSSSGVGGVAQSNTQVASQPSDSSDPTVAQVNRIITDIEAQVMNSELFQALGARVSLIDKPAGILDQLGQLSTGIYQETQDRSTADQALLTTINTQVANLNGSIAGVQTQVTTLATSSQAQAQSISTLQVGLNNNTAGLQTETTARINADNALTTSTSTQFASLNQSLGLVQQQVNTISNTAAAQASTLTQVQASIGQNATAIAQETTARVSADNTLFGQWTVKIDQNGYVSGFGLASTANNAKPYSWFQIRADAFAISSPAGPDIYPQVPFVVYTTPTTAGGETIPAGVYMRSAMIANGTIGTAQIGQASIDTLRLQGQAVSLNRWFVGNNITISAASSATVIDVYVDFPADSAASILIFRYTVTNPSAALSMTAQIWWNNQLVTQEGSSVTSNMSTQVMTMCQVNPTQGSNHFQCVAYSPGNASFQCTYPNLVLIGAKR